MVRAHHLTVLKGLPYPEQARGIHLSPGFEPHRFHRDIFNSGGRIARWPDCVPIPEFHGIFPRGWNGDELRRFLLRCLHPDPRERTSFVRIPVCSCFNCVKFMTITDNKLAGSHCFFLSCESEGCDPLPADIQTPTWHRFARRQALMLLMGSPASFSSVHAEPEWDGHLMRIDLLRWYYNSSVLERDSRMVVTYGKLLLDSLRFALPETAPLEEALNIRAQLRLLGVSFPVVNTPALQLSPSELARPPAWSGNGAREHTPTPSIPLRPRTFPR